MCDVTHADPHTIYIVVSFYNPIGQVLWNKVDNNYKSRRVVTIIAI